MPTFSVQGFTLILVVYPNGRFEAEQDTLPRVQILNEVVSNLRSINVEVMSTVIRPCTVSVLLPE